MFHCHVSASAVDVSRRLLNLLFSAPPRDKASLNPFSTYPACSLLSEPKPNKYGSSHAFHTSNLHKNHIRCEYLSPRICKYNHSHRIDKPVYFLYILFKFVSQKLLFLEICFDHLLAFNSCFALIIPC